MKTRIKNRLSEITRLSNSVESYGEQTSLPQKILFQINICLDELLTNIINYGYNDDTEHDIILDFEIEEELLIIKIIDDARPFNPLEQEEPDTEKSIEDREIGGLGIHIVKNMMDGIEYKRETDQNILILKKQITV